MLHYQSLVDMFYKPGLFKKNHPSSRRVSFIYILVKFFLKKAMAWQHCSLGRNKHNLFNFTKCPRTMNHSVNKCIRSLFLKKLWCCVGGQWKRMFRFIKKSIDVSSVSPRQSESWNLGLHVFYIVSSGAELLVRAWSTLR